MPAAIVKKIEFVMQLIFKYLGKRGLTLLLSIFWLSGPGLLALQAQDETASDSKPAYTIASYNVENYLIRPTERRSDKPLAGQKKIQEVLLKARPDIVALQEMGSRDALESLRQALKDQGLVYNYWDHTTGYDPDIHLALLSRYPITGKTPHSRLSYRLDNKSLQVSRGFLEAVISVNDDYQLTVMVAHLKSKRPVSVADQSEMRLMEALELRRIVDARLEADPAKNIVVLGDMNDTKDSRPVRALISQGRFRMKDVRPAERNGDNLPNPNPRYEPRNVTWTHYYGKEDSYSRIDYILVSPGLENELKDGSAWIPMVPNWGQGSDHRLIIAGFYAEDL